MTGLGYFGKVLSTWSWKGRARRREYWYYILFNAIVAWILQFGGITIFGRPQVLLGYGVVDPSDIFSNLMNSYVHLSHIPLWIYTLATLVPNICVSVRRLHDTGKSGWWLLLPLAPLIVGSLLATINLVLGGLVMLLTIFAYIVLFVFMLLDSNFGENKYGPNPKEADWDIPMK